MSYFLILLKYHIASYCTKFSNHIVNFRNKINHIHLTLQNVPKKHTPPLRRAAPPLDGASRNQTKRATFPVGIAIYHRKALVRTSLICRIAVTNPDDAYKEMDTLENVEHALRHNQMSDNLL